ncbi:MAG: glycine--tRNA ligase [Candidatus Handelsmanbacteria bacterium RIFCSPLOWO2_12_FULL_64_10]|uniref:Glycine--tRNA ligase n=1 Tax=Handelsmanbacteria sp. (strain RIFCSPLOWO2_12_FULL_64_10) TaxID=1817868 RepID=A0A1F6C9E0_HANXR|nr:MAG: glycine--tRNA ligase [Candidatus Handelsmanbacteria bacterium RIFCSPLOWO2_12_FULL_64_10]
MDTLVSLCKRRGFVFQSSEIYGGTGSCWDYGPLGVELKRNIKEAWWRAVVRGRDDMVGLDAAILMHPKVWEASGHITEFKDPLVDCKSCKSRWKADDLKGDTCPRCGNKELTEPRSFNLMFKTFMGPVEEEAAVTYLRPETAQGIFVNFDNVLQASRKKLPFGIAQIGKSFRNEITPGNFIFRTREFEQMEIEYFVKPGTDVEQHERWIEERWGWYTGLGIRAENLRRFTHPKEKLAHYAKACVDIEYNFPQGWSELEGIANRTDYDLGQHSKASGKTLTYFDDETKAHVTPFVIEPSAGVDRSLLAFLVDAYHEEDVRGETRKVLRLHRSLAPIKAAVLPLLKKRGDIVEACRKLAGDLRHFAHAVYDDTAAIGRLYRRQDEVGTPLCVTVDVDTIETDKRATIRDRDSMEQVRVPLEQVSKAVFDFQCRGWNAFEGFPRHEKK